jgi:hypothetical protein
VCRFLIVVYASGWSNIPPANVRLVLLLYLALAGPQYPPPSEQVSPQPRLIMVADKIAHVKLVTVGMAVWATQRRAYFNRMPGDAPCSSASIANITALSSARETLTRWLAPALTCGESCSVPAVCGGSILPRSMGCGHDPPHRMAPRRSCGLHLGTVPGAGLLVVSDGSQLLPGPAAWRHGWALGRHGFRNRRLRAGHSSLRPSSRGGTTRDRELFVPTVWERRET